MQHQYGSLLEALAHVALICKDHPVNRPMVSPMKLLAERLGYNWTIGIGAHPKQGYEPVRDHFGKSPDWYSRPQELFSGLFSQYITYSQTGDYGGDPNYDSMMYMAYVTYLLWRTASDDIAPSLVHRYLDQVFIPAVERMAADQIQQETTP